MSGRDHKIKVLNVQPFDYLGSIQLRSLRVAEGLKQFNVETIFLVPKTKTDESRNLYSNAARAKGFKVYQTNSIRPLFIKNLKSLSRGLELLTSFPTTIVQLYRLFEIEKPDVVQINGFVCIQEAIATRLFHKKRRSWVLISDLYPRSLIFVFLFLLKSFDRIFVSRKLISYYLGRKDDMTIYEPVDTDFFNPVIVSQAEKERLKQKFGLEECSPLVVSTAMISPQKGLEHLVFSMKKLKEVFPQIKLVVIGDVIPSQTDYYQNLRQLAIKIGVEGNIKFTHYIPTLELRGLLSVADVFVMSSIHEGTPVSILEAMSMEKAVIATDVGGVSEQVVNGETGVLIPSKNPRALTDAVVSLVQNRDKRIAMGKKARRRVKLMFSLQRCVLQYKESYFSSTSDRTCIDKVVHS